MTDLRCLDKQCNDGDLLNGEPGPRLATHGLLCTRCAAALERRLAELPARRDMLRDVLAGTTGNRGLNKPTKGDPPVPLNLAAHDHLQQMQAVVVTWVQLVCEERGLRGPDDSDLRRLAPWLVSQVEWIVQQMWVDDLAEEMRDLSRAADGLTQHKARWERLPAACPDCQAQELYRWPGEAGALCQSCGINWEPGRYSERVTERIDEGSLTAAQAAERLNVPTSTFRRWVADEEPKIKPIGKDANGVARFDPKDVDNLKESA